MSVLDITAIEAEARKQINEEIGAKAKTALVKKYRDLAAAEAIVKNIGREIEDLKQSIIDGSFTS